MAKKAPKDYKPGQRVIVKLSNGRIEEARINHVLEHSDRDVNPFGCCFCL